MKREWYPDELMEHWTMLPQEHQLLGNKSIQHAWASPCFKYFQYEGRFLNTRVRCHPRS